MRRVVLLALTLAACAQPVVLSADEANAVLRRYGAPHADACAAEGLGELRAAARWFGQDKDANGVSWLDEMRLAGAAPRGHEVMLAGALAMGFVRDADFAGVTRKVAAVIVQQNRPEISDPQRALEVACPEMMALHAAVSTHLYEMSRRMMNTRGRASDSELMARTHRDNQRVRAADARVQAALAAVEARLRAAEG